MSVNLLRRPRVQEKSATSRSSFYAQVSQGLWPKPVAIGPRTVAWPEDEVDAVIAARIAGRSEEQIRALVKQLEARRKSLRNEGNR